MHQHLKPFFMRLYFAFFISLSLLSVTICYSQLTINQIDSLCNEAGNKKNLYCTIACGFGTSHTNCYKDYNSDTLISCSGFIDKNDSNFQYRYYYYNNQPVKVTLSFKTNKKSYSATYYFSNNKAIKTDGENKRFSNEAAALAAGLSHTFWYPKKNNRSK